MYNSHTKIRTEKKGAVFIFMVLIISVISIAIATGFSTPNIREFKNAIRDNLSNNAFIVSEVGNEDVFYRLKNGMNVPAEIITSLNGTDSTTTVTQIDPDTKEIVTRSVIENHTRISKLEVNNSNIEAEFLYGAQIGSWGVEMNNNTEVKGVLPAVGDIYSGGSIRGSGSGVTVTGNIFVSTGISEDFSASSTSCAQDQIVGQTNPEVDYAQSFVASTTADLVHRVEIFLKKNGNPSSQTVYVLSDNAGSPDPGSVVMSGTLDRNKVSSVYSWVSITMDSPTSLTGGSTYWITLDAVRHNSKYWIWCKDTSGPYVGGLSKYSEDWNVDPWTLNTGDLTFRMYYGEGSSEIDGVDDLRGDAHADTITNSTILGDAYYNTISGSSVVGTSYPGSPTPSEVVSPINDLVITNWVSAAEAGGTISGNCPGAVGCSDVMGPVKVDGDFTVVNGSSTVVAGILYITGNFFTDNNVNVSCDPAYGATSCIIVVDGYMDFRNNSVFTGSGSPGSFILVVSRKDGCLGVATTTSCGPGNSAIYHNNNASTGGIFFAPDSIAFLENGASVSSVLAKGLLLSNNSSVVYDVDLQDIELSAGSSGGWFLEDWREIE